jgi:hypothetical protein
MEDDIADICISADSCCRYHIARGLVLLSLASQYLQSELGWLAQGLLLIAESEHLVFLAVVFVVLTLWQYSKQLGS